MADSFVDFEQKKFDVCVVGCGLAGLLSACRAALEGASVLLCSSGHIFNGSSFYPGTWGMGLIAPVDTKNDAADLAQSICETGRHVADPVLVKEFVDKIAPSLEFMRTHMRIKFLQPKNTSTQEFIPCFDKKHRLWFGLEQSNMREQLQTLLDKLPIFIMEKSELIDFSHEGKPFRKLIFYSHSKKDFVSVYAKAVVLACGGFAQLFEKTLSPHENYASVQAIALRHGAALTNLEFFQIMPALLKPKENKRFCGPSLVRLHTT